MSACVIDSSAVMAFLNREPGEPAVSDWLDRGAAASALILQEVMSNLVRLGLEREAALEAVAGLGLKIHDLTEPLALEAGAIALIAKPFGLSHGDRACLALARQLGLPAVTADRAWADAAEAIKVEVVIIR
jgi:PIN domain nuclease of toxin-antitoxin system